MVAINNVIIENLRGSGKEKTVRVVLLFRDAKNHYNAAQVIFEMHRWELPAYLKSVRKEYGVTSKNIFYNCSK